MTQKGFIGAKGIFGKGQNGGGVVDVTDVWEVDIAFTSAVPFDKLARQYLPKKLTQDITFTIDPTNAKSLATVEHSIIGNGVNNVFLTNFVQNPNNTLSFDNTDDMVNVIYFHRAYDGRYYYTIFDQFLDTATPPELGEPLITNTERNEIKLSFSEAVTLTTAGYSVTGITGNPTITGVLGSGTANPILQLSASASEGDSPLLSYDSGTGDTQDSNSNPLASFTDRAVTNEINDLTILDTPVQSALVVDSPTQLTASWGNITGNQGYNVRISTDQFTWTDYQVAQDVITYQFDDLTPSTLYYVDIQAIGDDVTTTDSLWSNRRSAQTQDPITLGTPSVVLTVLSSSEIQADCGQITNNSGYQWEISEDQINWDEFTTGANVNTYTFIGLDAGTLYYVRAKALGDGIGYVDSAYSTIVSDTTQAAGTWSSTASRSGLFTDAIGCAVDGANGKLYILERVTRILRKIDIATWTEDANITLTGSLGGQLTIAGTTLYATMINTTITEVNLTTFTQTANHNLSAELTQTAGICNDGTYLYVSGLGSGDDDKIHQYDLATLTLQKTITNTNIDLTKAMYYADGVIYGVNGDILYTLEPSAETFSTKVTQTNSAWTVVKDTDNNFIIIDDTANDEVEFRDGTTYGVITGIVISTADFRQAAYYNNKCYIIDKTNNNVEEFTFS